MIERGPGRPFHAVRALIATGAAVLVFLGFSLATTQVRMVRLRSPWAEDPWDAIVSFTMQLVVAVMALTAVRVVAFAWPPRRPIDPAGLRRILRGCDVALASITLTIAADALALALGAEPARPTGLGESLPLTLLPIALITAIAVGFLAITWHRLGRRGPQDEVPSRDPVASALAWAVRILPHPFDRPIVVLAGLAVLSGLTLSIAHTVVEGVPQGGPAATLTVMGVFAVIETCGAFVLGLGAAWYLRAFPGW